MTRRPARRRPSESPGPPRGRRAGFTLAELVVSLTVLALVGAVGAGLSAAALRARDHAFGTAACAAQARAAGERVRRAVANARALHAPGGAVPGVVAVGAAGGSSTGAAFAGDGTRLVVWCGGRDGTFPGDPAAGDAHDLSGPGRLPRADELLIFTADPARPWRLAECWPAGDASPVDLWAADLPDRIEELLKGADIRPLTLCDRVRVRSTPGGGAAACVRFTVEARPTAAELAAARGAADPAAAWDALPWVHGSRGPDWGLRAVRVRACVQLTPLDAATSGPGHVRPVPPGDAIPFVLPAARTAAFRPD